MTDLEDRLERFETLTAECELITKLATDSRKREFYLKLSEQYPPAGGGYAAGNCDQGRSLTALKGDSRIEARCRASLSLRDLARSQAVLNVWHASSKRM